MNETIERDITTKATGEENIAVVLVEWQQQQHFLDEFVETGSLKPINTRRKRGRETQLLWTVSNQNIKPITKIFTGNYNTNIWIIILNLCICIIKFSFLSFCFVPTWLVLSRNHRCLSVLARCEEKRKTERLCVLFNLEFRNIKTQCGKWFVKVGSGAYWFAVCAGVRTCVVYGKIDAQKLNHRQMRKSRRRRRRSS